MQATDRRGEPTERTIEVTERRAKETERTVEATEGSRSNRLITWKLGQ
ncbi:hypothetical protein [Lysinibacillus sp. NPDC056232]